MMPILLPIKARVIQLSIIDWDVSDLSVLLNLPAASAPRTVSELSTLYSVVMMLIVGEKIKYHSLRKLEL